MADGVFFEAKSRIARAAAIPLRLCVSAVKQNTLAPSRPRGNHPITDQQLQSTAPHFRKRNRKHKRKAALRTLSPNCYLLSPVKLNAAAFSLTEVVIALGIFAISMVGILALFPVASSAGRESSEETQAAIIAQTVLGDLRASAGALGQTNGWMVVGPNTFGQLLTNRINLNQSSDTAIAYDITLRNLANSGGGAPQIGPPIGLKALALVQNYSNAVTVPGAIYATLTRVRPVGTAPGLAAVTVEVSTPANVALTNRRVYSFSSLITGP
jgi:type II secretory pathway pseudopilin PulG